MAKTKYYKTLKRDGISAPKKKQAFLPPDQLAEKRPTLFRLLRFMLAQKKKIFTQDVVDGMLQRRLHYPRWKKYLQSLADMGYLDKEQILSKCRKKTLFVFWWVVPKWREELKKLAQSPLWERVRKDLKLNGETGCWEWQGYKDANGMGIVGWDNRAFWVHYVTWVIFNGKPPEKEWAIQQTCKVACCANPKHLVKVEVA